LTRAAPARTSTAAAGDLSSMLKLTAALAVSALALPVATAGAEEPSSTDQQNAAKLCKQLRTSSGSTANFTSAVKALVTTKKVTDKNAYGKCVSFYAKDEAKERTAAQKQAVTDCKAEREAAVTDEQKAAFATKYGAKNNASAYGKCVSQHAKTQKAEADENDQNRVNAAKTCKTERGTTPESQEAFAKKYRNFGKCVSEKARENKDEADEQDKAEAKAKVNAAKKCKAERKDDPEGFAERYGTRRNAFGKCVSKNAQAQNDDGTQTS